MPFYHYRCSKCEKIFEKFHGMSEKATDCEVCSDKNTLVKLINSNINVGNVSKVGNVVRDFIEAAKEELKENKDKLLK